MIDDKIVDVCTEAVEIYGNDAQIWMAIEEMAELTNALAKHRRGRVGNEEVCEEIADVIIMLVQLAYIFSPDDVCDFVEKKIERLIKRLANHK